MREAVLDVRIDPPARHRWSAAAVCFALPRELEVDAMTTPEWVLLGFAGWTLTVLFLSVGVYRWSHILTRRRRIADFRADGADGPAWYQRATRAHANCIENLPVYGAIVLAARSARVDDGLLDTLACILLAARLIQSTLHISLEPSDRAVSVRFAFYLLQIVCMLWMGIHVALAA
ncbi:MAG: MAPEG family protein [Myxococcales bacterium]